MQHLVCVGCSKRERQRDREGEEVQQSHFLEEFSAGPQPSRVQLASMTRTSLSGLPGSSTGVPAHLSVANCPLPP